MPVTRRVEGDANSAAPSAVVEPARSAPVDDQTFTTVFREHHPACLRLARRIVRDDQLAHEVVQEVFLAWWRGADDGGYRADRGELRSWLAALTRNKAVDAVRSGEKQRRLVTAAAIALPSLPPQRLVDDVVWWNLGRQHLVTALATLTPLQREVLDLAYSRGLTQAEIASHLSIPIGTVKSRTHAAMLRLKAALGDTWTPSDTDREPQQPLHPPADAVAADRWGRGSLRRAGAQTVLEQAVDRCAAALIAIAADARTDDTDTTAMARTTAALVDEHGDTGLHELIATLARQAAAATDRTQPTVAS